MGSSEDRAVYWLIFSNCSSSFIASLGSAIASTPIDVIRVSRA